VLATLQKDSDSASVVGAEAVRPRLGRYLESKEVDSNFAVLPSNGMGCYGQYYGGSIYALGLTHRTEDGIDKGSAGERRGARSTSPRGLRTYYTAHSRL
jgi:hypothetical protein